MSRDLPQFPNLEHLKKQAKVLFRRLQDQKPDAKLSDAQLVVARQYGFLSWAKLKAHVESMPDATKQSQEVPAPGGFMRYTETARRTIFLARHSAAAHGSLMIETEHLLLGIV